MRRYTTAQARARMAELLDAAERGRPVVIERRGVRFAVQPQPARTARAARAARRKSLIASVDPAVARGEWTWRLDVGGLRFTARRRRR